MELQNDLTDRRELTLRAISLLGIKTKPAHISHDTHEVMVHCLFHGKDSNPSMGINIDKGLVHCFACGWSGSIETMYKELTGQSLKTVLGLTRDTFSNYAFHNKIQSFYNFEEDNRLKSVYINMDQNSLINALNNEDCKNYILSRGINLKTAESMHMQYAEDTCINNTKFIHRLMIPVYENSRLISYEGRRIFSTDPDPKVLYPKNCTVNTLYDIDNLNKNERLYAVEGLMDLAVLRSCDEFKNSTSIFGANLTHRQIDLFKQFKEVVYIQDLDDAGSKTVETLRQANLKNTYSLKLPSSVNNFKIKDVGDLPKAGILPQDLIDRKWLSYLKKLN